MGDAFAILLTRPASQGARFAAALRRRFPGVAVVESPLLAPVLLRPDLPAGVFDAVVFTSETGVASAAPYRAHLPRLAFCVGDRTAGAARAAGFDARSAAGDADALVAVLLHLRPGRVIHLHGDETRGDVAGRLNAAGIAAAAAVTYRQEARALTPEAQALLQGGLPVVAPVFSPRTGALLSRAAEGTPAPIWLAALSPAVAESVRLPTARRIVAARPDADAMLDAIGALVADPAARA